MRTIQLVIITIAAALFLSLTGCQEPKGYIELKEPKKELSDMPARENWLDMPLPIPTNESQD